MCYLRVGVYCRFGFPNIIRWVFAHDERQFQLDRNIIRLTGFEKRVVGGALTALYLGDPRKSRSFLSPSQLTLDPDNLVGHIERVQT